MLTSAAACRYAVIVPACDEAPCVARVLAELRAVLPEEQFVIAAGVNGSRDHTAEIARECGVLVAETAARGYGHGCQAAIDLVEATSPRVDGYVFYAADGANDPRDIPRLVAEHARGAALVLGCRTRTAGNWSPAQWHYVIANRLFGALCGLLTGRGFADLGPLRLIDRALFHALALREWTYGWTIEAQVRAVRLGARSVEIPVRERGRLAGEQKVSHVAWRHTLAVGAQIVAAGFRARFAGDSGAVWNGGLPPALIARSIRDGHRPPLQS